MASALNVTVHLLMGKKFKKPISEGKYGNALYIPIPFIDKSNFNEAYAQVEGKPGHYSVSDSVSIEESAKYFK